MHTATTLLPPANATFLRLTLYGKLATLNSMVYSTNTCIEPTPTSRSDTGSLEDDIVATAETVDRFGVLFFVLLTC
jgi:hypothetical protein